LRGSLTAGKHCQVTHAQRTAGTAHPTAAWTLQQLRETIPSDHRYRFLIHDGDGIFSPQLDGSIKHMELPVLKTPPRSPKTNSLCERVIGTLRRGEGCMIFCGARPVKIQGHRLVYGREPVLGLRFKFPNRPHPAWQTAAPTAATAVRGKSSRRPPGKPVQR